MPHKSFSGTTAQARQLRSSRHTTILFIALAAACLLVFLTARGASGQAEETEIDTAPNGAPYVAGELIVTYEESIPEAPVERVTEEVESTVEDNLGFVDAQLLGFPEVKEEGSQEEREETLEEAKEELEADPAVKSVDYNYLKELEADPNDPFFGRQWNLKRISAPAAWDTTEGDEATRIAVIDSGLDLDHPDFAGKVEGRINTSEDGGNANDTNGHGTHVAGIASAATGNNRGVAGTCPDCSLLIARAESRSGVITDAAVIAGIEWAIDPEEDGNDGNNNEDAADIINMSYSASSPSDAEQAALNRASEAGITLVAAAGNQDDNGPRYPAAYENVISVAATTRQDTRAEYSNFGPTIDVSAPGGSSGQNNSVYSTLLNGKYGNKSGTSMSSPVVAGIAGLLASQGLSNTEIRERIETTATDLGKSGRDASFGHGRVNANAAVNDLPGNTQPTVSNLKPGRGASLRAKRVKVGAVVRDSETDLTKRNITLLVDGKRRNFSYKTGNDRLVRKIKLPSGRHNVRVVVRDGDASSDARWTFKTKKRSARSAGQGNAGGGGGSSASSSG